MADQFPTISRARVDSILETNSVIRNTYILLAVSLIFSAAMAVLAMVTHARPMGLIIIPVYFLLFWFIHSQRNNALGIVGVFAFTGFMGYTLGPILNMYLYQFVNGQQLILTALGGTGIIFFGLSGYALTTRKDFSYLGGFLAVAGMVLMLGIVAGIFFHMPMFQLAISAGFVLFSAGIILFETSQIIQGGERNYILATVQIFAALYNLFLSLLQILSFFGGNRE